MIIKVVIARVRVINSAGILNVYSIDGFSKP